MKPIFFIILFFVCSSLHSQSTAVSLDGKIFKGTYEQTFVNETVFLNMSHQEIIEFNGGKIFSELLKVYSADSASYTATIDERRMTAAKIVNISTVTEGISDGEKVTIEFNGILVSDSTLTGIMKIVFSEGKEDNYNIEALLQ